MMNTNMMNVKHKTIDFNTVCERVTFITDTEVTTKIDAFNQYRVHNVERFSEYGLSTLGKTVGFPAPFIRKVHETNPALANTVVKDRVNEYFKKDAPEFFTREFGGQICGVVSNKYAYFDDNQVIDIISDSPLTKMGFQNAIITPERLHLRAIDVDNPFTIGNDDSQLYFAYFIDNSMVGQSSFKVQLGIYRLACTNGMIVPMREFVICRQVHRGTKDIAAEFNESVAFLAEKQEDIKALITGMASEDATIATLQAEFREDYIAKKLNTSKKETEKIFQLFESVYDGHSKWGMANAITEFARDLNDINRREFLERAAFRAA